MMIIVAFKKIATFSKQRDGNWKRDTAITKKSGIYD